MKSPDALAPNSSMDVKALDSSLTTEMDVGAFSTEDWFREGSRVLVRNTLNDFYGKGKDAPSLKQDRGVATKKSKKSRRDHNFHPRAEGLEDRRFMDGAGLAAEVSYDDPVALRDQYGLHNRDNNFVDGSHPNAVWFMDRNNMWYWLENGELHYNRTGAVVGHLDPRINSADAVIHYIFQGEQLPALPSVDPVAADAIFAEDVPLEESFAEITPSYDDPVALRDQYGLHNRDNNFVDGSHPNAVWFMDRNNMWYWLENGELHYNRTGAVVGHLDPRINSVDTVIRHVFNGEPLPALTSASLRANDAVLSEGDNTEIDAVVAELTAIQTSLVEDSESSEEPVYADIHALVQEHGFQNRDGEFYDVNKPNAVCFTDKNGLWYWMENGLITRYRDGQEIASVDPLVAVNIPRYFFQGEPYPTHGDVGLLAAVPKYAGQLTDPNLRAGLEERTFEYIRPLLPALSLKPNAPSEAMIHGNTMIRMMAARAVYGFLRELAGGERCTVAMVQSGLAGMRSDSLLIAHDGLVSVPQAAEIYRIVHDHLPVYAEWYLNAVGAEMEGYRKDFTQQLIASAAPNPESHVSDPMAILEANRNTLRVAWASMAQNISSYSSEVREQFYTAVAAAGVDPVQLVAQENPGIDPVLLASIQSEYETGGANVETSDPIDILSNDQLFGLAMKWYDPNAPLPPAIHIRHDTVVGRIFLGLTQKLWNSSDTLEELHIAKAMQRLTDIPSDRIMNDSVSADPGIFSANMERLMIDAGYAHLLVSPAPASAPHMLAADVNIDQGAGYYDDEPVRIRFDLDTAGRDWAYTQVFTMSDPVHAIATVRSQTFVNVPLANIGMSGSNIHLRAVSYFRDGSTAETISQPFEVRWDGRVNNEVVTSEHLSDDPVENGILNHMRFPFEQSDWSYGLVSGAHDDTLLYSLDFNSAQDNSQNVRAPTGGNIQTVDLLKGQVTITSTLDDGNAWQTTFLHMDHIFESVTGEKYEGVAEAIVRLGLETKYAAQIADKGGPGPTTDSLRGVLMQIPDASLELQPILARIAEVQKYIDDNLKGTWVNGLSILGQGGDEGQSDGSHVHMHVIQNGKPVKLFAWAESRQNNIQAQVSFAGRSNLSMHYDTSAEMLVNDTEYIATTRENINGEGKNVAYAWQDGVALENMEKVVWETVKYKDSTGATITDSFWVSVNPINEYRRIWNHRSWGTSMTIISIYDSASKTYVPLQ